MPPLNRGIGRDVGHSLPYDAIIFDCDGTLVDSERLVNGVIVEYAKAFGIHITLDEALRRLKGGKMADCVLELESWHYLLHSLQSCADVWLMHLPADSSLSTEHSISFAPCQFPTVWHQVDR